MSAPHADSSPPHVNQWRDLCALADVPAPGEGGLYVPVGNRAVAVFRVNETGTDRIRVIDDHCPHAGASLSAGCLDRETIDPPNTCVVCPWHGWAFDVNSGLCPDNAAYRVGVYEHRVEAGRVWAKIDARD
jgi:nitrite reductase/ring-hydroxylating ferredoxin subunit